MHPAPETAATTDTTSALAKATIDRIEEAMQSGKSQCLPELVQIIHALSSKATEISVEDLADRVEKHVAVMARVIAAANTFGYNPGGIEINTLRQAIQVIGFERIRSLVTSLLLVRHAVDHEQAREQRSAALGAVVSGLMCQTIAAERGIVDPELAFISASLRQLGRLLLATYLPDEYKAAAAAPGDGFTATFGLTPVALGRAILAKARFPRRLLDSIQDYDPKLAPHIHPESAALLGLSEFSEQLCTLTLGSGDDREAFEHRVQELGERFGDRLSFNREQLGNLLGFVGERLEKFTGNLGFQGVAKEAVSSLRWRSGRQASQPPKAKPPALPALSSAAPGRTDAAGRPADGRAQGTTARAEPAAPRGDSTPPVEPAPPSAPPAPESAHTAPGTPAEPTDIRTRHWRDGLVSLTSCLTESTIDMGSVYSLALDFVRQGFGAQEALLLCSGTDPQHFTATHGVGQVFHRVSKSRCVRRDERTVMGVCIARRENVLIHNTGDPRTSAYLPPWCNAASGWGAFVSIPLHDQNQCFALMIVAWPKPMQITLSQENARLLRSIASTVAAARRLSAG